MLKNKSLILASILSAFLLTACACHKQDLRGFYVPAYVASEKIDLSADALFPFNKSGINDIKAKGRELLDSLGKLLNETYQQVNEIKLLGHTDRLGSDEYNYKLGMERAQSVRDYLFSRGLSDFNISVDSAGETQPVSVGCETVKAGAALKECLEPDRRVSVEIIGVKKRELTPVVKVLK